MKNCWHKKCKIHYRKNLQKGIIAKERGNDPSILL